MKINTRILKHLERPEQIITLWGGSASGKTTNVLLWMLSLLLSNGSKVWNGAIVRRYYPELKKGLWKDANRILDDFGVTKRVKIDKTNLIIEYGKRTLFFMNAENSERFKGLEMNTIFIDEINQLEEETFLEIKNRTGRKVGSETKIITAFNPISAQNWAYRKLVMNPFPNSFNVKLTYHDNRKNLSESYIQNLENDKEICPRRYQIYTLGNPGVFEGLIFSSEKWSMIDKPLAVRFDCFGLDFGFNHPTAMIGIKKQDDGSFYVHEVYYKSGTTVSDLIEYLEGLETMYHFKTDNIPIYCDYAEADRIEELNRHGFRAIKANKDVDAGISLCQSKQLILSPYSKNLRNEMETYCWQKDKNGSYTDKPVKMYDDACDALRYGLYSHFGKPKTYSSSIPYISSMNYTNCYDDWDEW